MINALFNFRDAIHAAGLEPPNPIEPGKIHRFPGNSKRPSNRAGWCLLFDDGLGGCFGDWSTGLSETWQAKRDKPYTLADRAAFTRRVETVKQRGEAERKTRQATAACSLAVNEPTALVLAAIDAGNLEPLALAAHHRWPTVKLMIAGDDDRQTAGNPGATKAKTAAIASGALLSLPQWPDNAPEHLTDFNDLAVWLAGGRA